MSSVRTRSGGGPIVANLPQPITHRFGKFSRWSVRIVNEFNRFSKEAQDLLLTYIDRLPPGRAFCLIT